MTKTEILKLAVRSKRRHNLTFEEFYNLTPREFSLFEEDYREELLDRDLQFARICVVIANIHRDRKRKPFREIDFVNPSLLKHEKHHDDPNKVADDIRKLAKQFKFKRIS